MRDGWFLADRTALSFRSISNDDGRYSAVELEMTSSSQIDAQFSGISTTSTYPPHNALAVGPAQIVMAEGSRMEWTNLTGGGAALQSVYSFFSPLGAAATNSLYDPRCIYDTVSGRFIVIMENLGSGGAISNIAIAVSKDSNPNTVGTSLR
jgi:hypothetical protein